MQIITEIELVNAEKTLILVLFIHHLSFSGIFFVIWKLKFQILDYDKEKIELAMKLDVEKSKLMGGDLENTHFVKGFKICCIHWFFYLLS